ncbi:MAG: hypothetical protein ACI81T_001041 [Bacteroidia bacterium]
MPNVSRILVSTSKFRCEVAKWQDSNMGIAI